ncbi:fungal-specific transcription factor domain-containing protein [Trametes maxima]|nr:fungal-specific transcription factor domain-containing protein [Trametes maxima]
MPLSGRNRPDGDKERSAKTQEQELKRARGAISCAECRRLKLKCDKTVPCSSCKRRGCASICPNGSLTTGQGTRFILADTDRLHRKIAEMSDRIRQLEDGLAILQSSVTRDPHPLLSQDLLKIKSGLELHSATRLASGSGGGGIEAQEPEEEEEEEAQYIDAFGTLAVRDDGAATFYGRSAGSESLLIDEKPHPTLSTLAKSSSAHPDLPTELNRLAATFPSGPSEIPVNDLQELMQSYLPPWQRAAQLCDLYLEQAPWFFGAVTSRQLHEEVLPLFYEEAADAARARVNMGASAPPSGVEAFNLPASGVQPSSHDLALLFVVFCFGALTDPSEPPAPHNEEAARYYQLTRAALSLEPVLDRPPSVTTVQTISLMGIYQGMVADEHSIETTWALMGLSSKLAQSIGLHRDSARWKLSASEVQKRRALFWELFITDCWQALATGRLPTFAMQFVDAELPADPDQSIADDGSMQLSFPAWKAQWGKECVSNVVMGTLTAQAPKYSVILDLDRRIRDMALPKYALGPAPQNAGLAQTMSHYMPTNYLHLTLLYVHRCFFAQAIVDSPSDPMRSQYAPSFLAGYRSASALLSTIREQFALFPVQIARFWVLWTHAFSACVMMGSVVTRGGTSKTAQAALGELRSACELFEHAAPHGGRAGKFLPVVRKLHEKAQAAYYKGFQPLRRDIFASQTDEGEHFDELSIFTGRTARTVATKSNRPQRISPSVSSAGTPPGASGHGSQTGSSDSDTRNSQSPAAEAFPALDSSYRAVIHPGLVDELKTFEGQINAQTNPYYNQQPAGHFEPHVQQPQGYGGQPHQGMQHTPQQQQYDSRYQGHQQHSNVSPPTAHMQHDYPTQYVQQQHQQQLPQQHQQQQYTSHVPDSQSRRMSYHAPAPAVHDMSQSLGHPQVVVHTGDSHVPPMSSGLQRHPSQHQYEGYMRSGLPSHPQTHSGYSTPSIPVQRSELWSVPSQSVDSSGSFEGLQYHNASYSPLDDHGSHAHSLPPPQYSHSQHPSQPVPAPVHIQVQSQTHVHPQQTPGQYSQGQQYAYTQQVQQMVPPPPPPLIHVHTGGYSLQETWTSFIQHELPTPPQGAMAQQSMPSAK